jgi:uncharacterized protein YcfL
VPASDTRPYYAALSRYSANSETDYAFAITQAATFGESEPQIIAVTNLRNTRSYLETSNVLGSQVEMKLTWHDQNGVELGTLLAPIGPKATVHIPLMNQLPEGFSGSLRMEADNASALVAQSIVYQYDQGYQEVLEAQQVVPISSFATKLSTSFNLYLGMANWLRLINLSDSSVEVVLNYSAEYGQTYTLKAHARTDIAVHELPLSADSYGALTLEVNRAAGLGGELVRARQDSAGKFEMLTTIPLR